MKKDLTGKWEDYEDFGFGYDQGKRSFTQEGLLISGSLVTTEYIDGEEPFTVDQKIEGKWINGSFLMRAVDFKIISGNPDIDYELDSWEGAFTEAGLIEGICNDLDGIGGSFSLKRLD